MSRWITISACLSVLILTAFSAHAAERSQLLRLAQADNSDLPRNIELKEGAKVAEDAKPADDKTRQIVTEGKEEAPAAAKDGDAAPPADAAKEAAPADAAAKDAAPPPTDAAPPPAAAKEGAPPPGAPPPAPVVEGPPPGDIVVAVQTELHRVGCDPGPIDGVWGGQSREALAAFGNFAKVEVGDLSPTPEIYGLIKGKTEVVCPVHAEAPPHHEPPPPSGYGGGGYDHGGYGGGYGGGGGY
jgi:putative peptidoglycan binding protein